MSERFVSKFSINALLSPIMRKSFLCKLRRSLFLNETKIVAVDPCDFLSLEISSRLPSFEVFETNVGCETFRETMRRPRAISSRYSNENLFELYQLDCVSIPKLSFVECWETHGGRSKTIIRVEFDAEAYNFQIIKPRVAANYYYVYHVNSLFSLAKYGFACAWSH